MEARPHMVLIAADATRGSSSADRLDQACSDDLDKEGATLKRLYIFPANLG